ncbi:hypothetical protein ACFL2D_00720 [Patescibacteria group bacterium]
MRKTVTRWALAFLVIEVAVFLFWGIWGLCEPIPVDELGVSRMWDVVTFPLFAIYMIVGTLAVACFLGAIAPFEPLLLVGILWVVTGVGAILFAPYMGPWVVLCAHFRINCIIAGAMAMVGLTMAVLVGFFCGIGWLFDQLR